MFSSHTDEFVPYGSSLSQYRKPDYFNMKEASRCGDLSRIKAIITNGASILEINAGLVEAAKNDQIAAMELLLDKGGSLRDGKALFGAVQNNNLKSIQWILKKTPSYYCNLKKYFIHAACKGDIELLKILLSYDKKSKVQSFLKKMFYSAASNGQTKMLEFLIRESKKCKSVANLPWKRALELAVQKNYFNSTSFLLEHSPLKSDVVNEILEQAFNLRFEPKEACYVLIDWLDMHGSSIPKKALTLKNKQDIRKAQVLLSWVRINEIELPPTLFSLICKLYCNEEYHKDLYLKASNPKKKKTPKPYSYYSNLNYDSDNNSDHDLIKTFKKQENSPPPILVSLEQQKVIAQSIKTQPYGPYSDKYRFPPKLKP